MSRLRHRSSPRSSLHVSAVAASVVIHGIALGALAALSVAPEREETAVEVAAAFASVEPELRPPDVVARAEFAGVEAVAAAAETVDVAELSCPFAEMESQAAEAPIAVASPYGRGTARIGPRRVRGGTGGGPADVTRGAAPGADGGVGDAIGPSAAFAVPAPPPPAPDTVRIAARVLRTAKPDYPERARERGIEGRVVLVAEILADGSVGEVAVMTSSGCDDLDAAAIECVRRRWRFEAAREDGVGVPARVRLPVFVFRIDG